MDELAEQRHIRKLKIESAAESMIRFWLTGEYYEDPPKETQRRRKYRKTWPQPAEKIQGTFPEKLTGAAGELY
jgi:hypothetical protein